MKKIVAILLSLAALLSLLTACDTGGSSDDGSSTPQPSINEGITTTEPSTNGGNESTPPNGTPTHTCSFDATWKNNETEHWRECSCEAKSQVAAHQYSKKVTAPTNTEKGYTTYTCFCGFSYRDNYVPSLYSSGLTYQIANRKCTITGIGDCTDTTVLVPPSIQGYPVTTIGNAAFQNCDFVVNLILPESVEIIGASAFSNCESLELITLPSSLSSIPSHMLESCTSLTNIVYSGSQSQWERLTKGSNWNSNIGFSQVNCTGQPLPADCIQLSTMLQQFPAATHTAGDQSLLYRYTSCSDSNYLSFCEWYEENGYTEYCESSTQYTLSKTYVKNDAYATIFYQKIENNLYVTSSSKGASLLPQQITEYETLHEVTVTQPYTQKKGTCEIVRLADGTFLILDSSNSGSHHEIYNMLCALNGGSQNIHIRAWLLSHTHGDHYGGFVDFAQSSYATRVTLDTVLYAPVHRSVIDTLKSYGTSWDTISYYFNDTLPSIVKNYFPNADLCSIHAGQRFHFAGVDLDVLYTPEHLYIDSMPVNMNHGSIVCMLSDKNGKMLFTGDSENSSNGWLMNTYKEELKCDILQYPHHGNTDSHVLNLVNYADPSVVFIPVTMDYFYNSISADRQALVNHVIGMTTVKASYFMGHGSVTLLLSGKEA